MKDKISCCLIPNISGQASYPVVNTVLICDLFVRLYSTFRLSAIDTVSLVCEAAHYQLINSRVAQWQPKQLLSCIPAFSGSCVTDLRVTAGQGNLMHKQQQSRCCFMRDRHRTR